MRRSSFPPPSDGERASALLLFFRCYAVQDLVLMGYLLVVLCVILARPTSEAAAGCAHSVYWSFAAILVGAFVARGGLMRSKRVGAVIYRVTILGVILGNYLMLRDVLPVVRADTVDAALYRLDLRLFHVEPALWLERFNHHGTVEWFAFFYFSYFILALVYMVAVIWVRPGDRATAELAIGTTIVFCVGQLGYMAVPGFGPGRFLAASYHGPLHGGLFWSAVIHVVDAGSAMKDIFPSLHTAVPTMLSWFAWHRAVEDRRWRVPAIVTTFFAVNIIISTMLLRWHFAIDVVAGLFLGCSAGLSAPRIAAAEARARRDAGMSQPWVFADA